MKIIDFSCIKSLGIDYAQCLQWVETVIKGKSDTILPPKTHMNLPNNVFCNVMPSIVNNNGSTLGGVKVITRYPDNIPSLNSRILLMDMITGEFLALLDGNWITAMRTGAVAAHSIKLLAKSNYKKIGIIGLGNTARATLLILAENESNKSFDIKLLKYKNQAELFMDRFKEYDNLRFTVVNNPEELILGSDVIVSCATYFESDICDDCYFDEGVLVVPVHTRGFTNCDLFFDKIFADDAGHVADFKNFKNFRYFAEISDIVNNKAKGRENDDERILAYNIGVSIHDIYFASQIYNIVQNNTEIRSKLINIDFHDPTDKFWV